MLTLTGRALDSVPGMPKSSPSSAPPVPFNHSLKRERGRVTSVDFRTDHSSQLLLTYEQRESLLSEPKEPRDERERDPHFSHTMVYNGLNLQMIDQRSRWLLLFPRPNKNESALRSAARDSSEPDSALAETTTTVKQRKTGLLYNIRLVFLFCEKERTTYIIQGLNDTNILWLPGLSSKFKVDERD